ncbi:MAG: DNRLRE domain-containing protein, partial [Clostridia bacterium]|nr:DNRLRE domain-containing protein [Clostridia bacterium]
MKKYAFRKIFAIVLTTALVLAFTVPVSATGAPEEVYTPTEVTVPEAPDDIPESAAEPTGEQLALIKDISVPEPTESVSETEAVTEEETEAPVAPSEEVAFEEPLDELLPEETIIEETITEEPNPEETVAEEPQEAPVDTVLEQEEIVYNTSALTLNNLPEYIVNNTLEKDVIAVGLAEEDMTELSSFTTINEDESRTLYLFGDPVKYIDKTDNSIRFIDNSIVPVTSENGGLLAPTVTGYKNGGNSYDLLMPNRINMGVRFTSDDISVLMTPAVASAAQGNLKSHSFLGITEQVVEYRNVFGSGIHLQYTPVNSGVKENIILDSYSGVNTFNFTISTGEYYPLYTEGEAIPFIDPTTDDTAFILGQVDARDSYTGEETDGHFTLYNSLSLTEIRPGLYTLTVTVDEEFLTDPDTVYPVVVDPTLTISATYIYDTTVYSGNPDKQAYYSSAYIVAGYHGTSGKEATAYVRCTSKILDYIHIRPNNISSAKYKIYEGSGKTNSMTVHLRGALSNWNQNSITYNNQPSLDSDTSSVTISKSGWYEFAATNLVKKWLKNARGESGGISFMSGFALK